MGGSIQRSERPSQAASAMPASAPIAASNRLSVRSCRARRQRPAPRAMRTLSSLRRAVARASCRLATFAPTIRNSTKQTAIRIRSGASSTVCIPRCAFHTGIRLAWKPSAGPRRFLRQAPRTRFHFRVRLLERHAGLQPRGHPHLPHAPVFQQPAALAVERRRHAHGDPDLHRMPGMVPRNSSGAMPATVSS